MEELFDNVVRERLKDILRQYELRERHFECVIRSKELEVLLSRARAAEQQQLAEGQANRVAKAEQEVKAGADLTLDLRLTCSQNEQLQKDLELSQNGQTMLIDKLIACCKEVRMTLVNHAYPLFGYLNAFSHPPPFILWIAFMLRMISRMRSGRNGCSRRYEKNWKREGQSSRLAGTERCNAIPPTPVISNRVWMKP